MKIMPSLSSIHFTALKAFFFVSCSYILPQIFVCQVLLGDFPSHSLTIHFHKEKEKEKNSVTIFFPLFTESSLKCSQTDDCVVLMRRSSERIFLRNKNAFPYTFFLQQREIVWKFYDEFLNKQPPYQHKLCNHDNGWSVDFFYLIGYFLNDWQGFFLKELFKLIIIELTRCQQDIIRFWYSSSVKCIL